MVHEGKDKVNATLKSVLYVPQMENNVMTLPSH